MTDKLFITLAQLNPVVGDIAGNLKKIQKVRNGVPQYTDIVVFSEMMITGYPPEDLVLKPFFMYTVEQAVQTLVEESKTKKPYLVISTPWICNGEIHNATLLIGDGEIKHIVCKYNLPNTGVFDEYRIFKPGNFADVTNYKGVNIGIMICEDMWTPEVAAHLKSQSADIFIVPNASPFEIHKQDTRFDLARSRIEETNIPLIYVNQCGGQDELVFDGASFVMNSDKTIPVQADQFTEQIIHTTWKKSDNKWVCETQDITPLNDETGTIYEACVVGLRDYVQKNGFPNVGMGLSGGIDSALCAAIAADALGPNLVNADMMNSQYTSIESFEDAQSCAALLGIFYSEYAIQPAVDAITNMLRKSSRDKLPYDTPPITFENIQSRIRGITLMALSNAWGSMVISTGNKSEMAVGYATLYGDMCGGFNPIKDLYKTQVYKLARWRNENKPDHALGPEGPVIPERILTKEPTAELRPDQKDSDSLPSYEILDDILECLIEDDMGIDEIIARGHEHNMVRKVWRMLDTAEYKRRQAPPGIKITRRAFGRDRRYPITNHFRIHVDKD